jgi:hypothetical protein
MNVHRDLSIMTKKIKIRLWRSSSRQIQICQPMASFKRLELSGPPGITEDSDQSGRMDHVRRFKRTRSANASRISLTKGWEVHYWTKIARRQREQLLRQHGHSADAVKQALTGAA